MKTIKDENAAFGATVGPYDASNRTFYIAYDAPTPGGVWSRDEAKELYEALGDFIQNSPVEAERTTLISNYHYSEFHSDEGWFLGDMGYVATEAEAASLVALAGAIRAEIENGNTVSWA